jgi:hypothetical protein
MGIQVDQLLEQIRARIAELESEEATLTKNGCIRAYPHFKTGTNKMYLLSPSEGGGRKFTYVGVDPEKQEKARKAIARYEIRETLRRQIRRMSIDLDGAGKELAQLGESCRTILKEDGISVWARRAG